MAQLNVDIASLSRSVAFLVDRLGDCEIVLGSAWLLDQHTAATCAHLVAPYEHELGALKLVFPASQKTCGVTRIALHPRFDRKIQAKPGFATPKTEFAQVARLCQYDAAILLLDQAPPAISDHDRQNQLNRLSAPVPGSNHGIRGKLSEIDLFMIVETISNTRKVGRIAITDSRNNPVAGVFCQDGLVTHVFFANLVNELAFYQIVQKQLTGNFYFEARALPDWDVDKPIARPPEMLVLEAHRRLEERTSLLASLGGAEAVYGKAAKQLDPNVLPAEVVHAAINLWKVLDGTIAINDLWLLVDFDDYGICMALLELLKTRQIEEVALNSGPIATGEHTALPPNLVLGLQTSLKANDELCAVSIEPTYGLARVAHGHLLGNLNRDDATHLLHDMRLLPQAQGCPILKNGEVIGIHCGPMPYGREVQIKEGNMQQMIWVQSLLDCIKQLGGNSTTLTVPSAGSNGQSTMVTLVNFQPATTAGCHDMANFSCPKCGAVSVCSANECKSCGQRFFPDIAERPSRSWEAIVYCVLIIILFVAICWPPPVSQATAGTVFSLVADPDWMQEKRWYNERQHWITLNPGEPVKAARPILFEVKLRKPCHVYILDKSSREADSLVAYPNIYPVPKYTKAGDELLPVDSVIRLPDLSVSFGVATSPEDTVILFASEKELPFVTDAKLANDAFDQANLILGPDLFSPPLELPASRLFQTDAKDSIVYVKRLIKDGHTTQ